MSNNNNLRRQLITEYINNTKENNNHISQMMSLMNNQENTLRNLLLSSESRTRSTHIPIFSSSINNPIRNPFHNLAHNPFQNPVQNNRPFQNNRIRPVNDESLLNLDNILNTFFLNIPVLPTRDEINRAVNNCLYSSIENPSNTSCPISLTRFEDNDEVSVIRYCNHVFKKEELESWFQENTRCPLCRYDIRTYVPR